eukprot:TRINITY_DN67489_c7_g1_i1.p2 TRINITY_DN67489_c7_g1~~TRINITY_DN67489_c7_g1_i1.p2  ORF type:complete len:107 (-),score=4.11 TRINITY_DN67489_c7_g1_i1:539-859(-)
MQGKIEEEEEEPHRRNNDYFDDIKQEEMYPDEDNDPFNLQRRTFTPKTLKHPMEDCYMGMHPDHENGHFPKNDTPNFGLNVFPSMNSHSASPHFRVSLFSPSNKIL